MMLIKVTNGVPEGYSIQRLRMDNPTVSFPAEMSDEGLAQYGVFRVVETPQPVVNSDTASVTGSRVELVDGVWRVVWDVEQKSADELRAAMRCTPRQARLALHAAGLLTTVEAAIAGLPDPAARIEWEYASEILRISPLVLAMTQALGLSDAQIDALFQQAATL